MLFAVDPAPSSGGAVDATLMDEFAVTGSTLTQLHNFFEHHTFDTAGPYSDLFSVLLSCCKHLVDTNLNHHLVLSDQKRELCGLSSGKKALGELTSHSKENIHEFKPSSLEHQIAEGENHKLLPSEAVIPVACEDDVDTIGGRLEETQRCLQDTKAEILELRRRQDELERQQLEYHCWQQGATEQMHKLEEDVDKLRCGTTLHAEYIIEEVEAVKNVVTASSYLSTEREETLRQYTDKKLEALRNEFCTAIWEAALGKDVDDAKTPTNQASIEPLCISVTNVKEGFDNRGGEGNVRRDGLAAGLRCLGSQALKLIEPQVEKLENRVEVLEVYAPHHRAMATRPPILGLELRDEKSVGVRVDKVFHNFAGERAGVLPGDILIAVNGQEVLTRAEIYAVMTEIVKEHQAKRCVLMQMYFNKYAGRNNKVGGGGAVVNGHDDLKFSARDRDVGGKNETDASWELPQLEFRLHLKRNGLLLEVALIADSSDETV